jgi:hypothetical protein
MTSWILPLGSSFQLYGWKEGNSGKLELLKDWVFHGQLMEISFRKHILSWQTWNTWKYEKEMGTFQVWYAKSLVHLNCAHKPYIGIALDMQYGCSKRGLNSSLLSLKTWFLVSI